MRIALVVLIHCICFAQISSGRSVLQEWRSDVGECISKALDWLENVDVNDKLYSDIECLINEMEEFQRNVVDQKFLLDKEQEQRYKEAWKDLKNEWKQLKSRYEQSGKQELIEQSQTTTFVQTVAGINIYQKVFNFTGIKTYGQFFTSVGVCMSPKQDANSGVYIFSSDKTTRKLYVYDVDRYANVVNQYDLAATGSTFDIVYTPWGFAVLYSSSSKHLAIMGVNQNKTVRFQSVIMNNTDCSQWNSSDNQWFRNSTAFGINCMYNPHNGKLLYLRGKIYIDFAHYNMFNGQGGHTGNSLFAINEDGTNPWMIKSWIVSHSLIQQIVTDGTMIVEASLSDAYPTNIGFTSLQYDGKLSKSNNSLISGTIPGSATGKADGRLGGLMSLGNQSYVCGYSKKPGKSYNGVVNSDDEFGLLFFNSSLQLMKKVKLNNGSQINSIRLAKYGKNIMIAYSWLNQSSVSQTGYNPDTLQSTIQSMYIMLVDENGNVLKSPELVKRFTLQAGTDFVNLADGRIGWVYVESTLASNQNVELYVTDWPTA